MRAAREVAVLAQVAAASAVPALEVAAPVASRPRALRVGGRTSGDGGDIGRTGGGGGGGGYVGASERWV